MLRELIEGAVRVGSNIAGLCGKCMQRKQEGAAHSDQCNNERAMTLHTLPPSSSTLSTTHPISSAFTTAVPKPSRRNLVGDVWRLLGGLCMELVHRWR